MSNCVFGFPDWTQPTPLYTPATATGGSWVVSLPASNMLDTKLSRVARSTDATTASTQRTFDLGRACTIGLLAVLIPNLTISSTPKVRFIAGTSQGFSNTYDSTDVQAVPSGITIEDLIQPDGSRMNLWQVFTPTAFSSRYPSILITDTGNADGYVDVARVIIAGAWTPASRVGISDGAKHQLRDDTVRTVTDGNSALYNKKRPARSDEFSIEDFEDADASTVRAMHRRLGISGQFFWIPDPADTTYGWQRNYLATMEELGALTANQGKTNGEFKVLEVL